MCIARRHTSAAPAPIIAAQLRSQRTAAPEGSRLPTPTPLTMQITPRHLRLAHAYACPACACDQRANSDNRAGQWRPHASTRARTRTRQTSSPSPAAESLPLACSAPYNVSSLTLPTRKSDTPSAHPLAISSSPTHKALHRPCDTDCHQQFRSAVASQDWSPPHAHEEQHLYRRI